MEIVACMNDAKYCVIALYNMSTYNLPKTLKYIFSVT